MTTKSYETDYQNNMIPLKSVRPHQKIIIGGNEYIVQMVTAFWVSLLGNGYKLRLPKDNRQVLKVC